MTPTTLVVSNATRGTLLAEHTRLGRSWWARFRGLMGRARLEPDEALWLPGTSGIHMLFMRFPIDALFVDRPADGATRVVAAYQGLAPWRGIVLHVRGAHGVIELPVGAIERSGSVPGDRLEFAPRPAAAPAVSQGG